MIIQYGTNENWRWDFDSEEARFDVTYDGKTIPCRVTRECIEDHCGDPKSADYCFTAAKEHFDAITDQVGFYVTAGRFEPDGSVLVRSQDWRKI